jgi:hypothetical protein
VTGAAAESAGRPWASYWRPEGIMPGSEHEGDFPEVGWLIAVQWGDRTPMRVTDVSELPEDMWDEEDRRDHRMYRSHPRPVRIIADIVGDPERKAHWILRHRHRRYWWRLREPYPVCSSCGLLWPCPCDHENRVSADAMRHLDELHSIMPGCCWSCHDPVTSRQRSVEFPGENLILPGGPAPLFHIGRGACCHHAAKYEDKWLAADPTRGSVFRCLGHLITHLDGSGHECSEGSACRGFDWVHRSAAQCVTALHTPPAGASLLAIMDGDDTQWTKPFASRACTFRGCRGVGGAP